jgi:hypothetical protein
MRSDYYNDSARVDENMIYWYSNCVYYCVMYDVLPKRLVVNDAICSDVPIPFEVPFSMVA